MNAVVDEDEVEGREVPVAPEVGEARAAVTARVIRRRWP